MESDGNGKAYLYAGGISLERVDDGHVCCLRVGLEEGSVDKYKRGKSLRDDSEGLRACLRVYIPAAQIRSPDMCEIMKLPAGLRCQTSAASADKEISEHPAHQEITVIILCRST